MKNNSFIRFGDTHLYTDIVKTGSEIIQIGTMPGISKFLDKKNINPTFTILLRPISSQYGDNYTGEEFKIWRKVYQNDLSSHYYIGYKSYVKYLYKRLKYTVNQTLNPEKTKIIKRHYIEKLFNGIYLKWNSNYQLNKEIKIYYSFNKIEIFNKEQLIYTWMTPISYQKNDQTVAKILKSYNKQTDTKDSLHIIPLGIGNGFNAQTSNFIVQYGYRNIWIDIMARPVPQALQKIKLHWDAITDYFISHIHEDHIEGFSTILHRISNKKKKINLITTKSIFKQIKKIFNFLFPHFQDLINFIEITPYKPLPYHKAILLIRHSHHVLKSGTLSLKIKYQNNIFTLSGDTFYSEDFEKRYPHVPSTDSSWYNDSHLIFHEAEFFSKKTVHTYYTDIKKLQNKVSGKILCYHNSNPKFLLPHPKLYKTYVIQNGNISVK